MAFWWPLDLQSLSHGEFFIADLFSWAVLVKYQNPTTSVSIVTSCWSSLRENLKIKVLSHLLLCASGYGWNCRGKTCKKHTMHSLCSQLGSACQLGCACDTFMLCRGAGHCCSIQELGGECFEHSISVLWKSSCMCRLPNVTFYLLWSRYELYITKSYMTLFVVGCLSELIS